MPRCYMLAVAGGSSLDRHSNNVTLFNLIEQVSVQRRRVPANAVLPVEVHAYLTLAPNELDADFELRFALVATSGLETCTDAVSHRSSARRYRTRTLGLPLPPVADDYFVRLDWRHNAAEEWVRDSMMWPLTIADAPEQPAVVH